VRFFIVWKGIIEFINRTGVPDFDALRNHSLPQADSVFVYATGRLQQGRYGVSRE